VKIHNPEKEMTSMTRKWLFYTGIFALVFIVTAFNKRQPEVAGLKTIIIDAGHGGAKPGARGWNGYWEKDIALAIALKLEKEVNKRMPDVKIYQTRIDDSDVDNRWRPIFANEKNGDIFVSIHCNSVDGYRLEKELVDSTEKMRVVKNEDGTRDTVYEWVPVYKQVKKPREARGLETYVWNPAHNSIKVQAAQKSIADKENEEILADPNYKEKYGGGLDINSEEFKIKATLRTKKYFRRSVMLASLVQEEGANAGRNDRNVKQRGEGIWVLQATNMPSILVETGYISHPEEEAYLASEAGQQEMAEIIAKALQRYKQELENQGKNEGGEQNGPPAPENNGNPPAPQAVIKNEEEE
jgi:N-acetylmuramoyl-L-alanine amidase